MKRSISCLNAVSDAAFTEPKTTPNNGGRSCVFSVTRVITPRLPPPPPFSPQNSSGLEWALAILTVSDHITTGEALPADQRERSFGAMVEIALEAAFS